MVHDDGTVRWVAARGRVLCDPAGAAARMLGAAYDTTAVHNASERLGRVLETMSTAFITLDLDWRFTYVNGAASGCSAGPAMCSWTADLWTMLPELGARRPGPATGRRWPAATRSASSTTTRRWTPGSTCARSPARTGSAVYFHDITGRVRAEQDAARLAGERADALAASGAATGRLQILSGAGARLAGTLEVDELLQILSDVIVNGFGTGVVVALKERIIRDLAGKETTPTAGTRLPRRARRRRR